MRIKEAVIYACLAGSGFGALNAMADHYAREFIEQICTTNHQIGKYAANRETLQVHNKVRDGIHNSSTLLYYGTLLGTERAINEHTASNHPLTKPKIKTEQASTNF